MKKTENSWWILAAEHVALTTLASLGLSSSKQAAAAAAVELRREEKLSSSKREPC